ncbi:MAG: isoprenylcysteine carboxylmethyltransferase family protein [Treponema sp.]|nr:isoprenylcysteine carboxylmethyltransferase family protein [Treponema sp.]
MIKYIPLLLLPVLVLMVMIRAAMLRRQGIKALVFGVTHKTDYFLIPVVALVFYALLAPVTGLPIPRILIAPLFETTVQYILATVICSASLIWHGITLRTFGSSFRVGIDKTTTDKLITTGPFALSRNPIYAGFLAFFAGILVAYPNIAVLFFLLFLAAIIHRQVKREEIFLKDHYGLEYRTYCGRVRRYL